MNVIANAAAGQAVAGYFLSPPEVFNQPPGIGFDLGVVYPAWLAAVVVLYFPCRWWAEQKKVRTDWWVRYL